MAKLRDSVKFEIDRLFNGAVDVAWLADDAAKAEAAAKAFVFHGPKTHGVGQGEAVSGHKLVDTASFVKNTLSGLAEGSSSEFSLAVAGYGSGKSHLAVTLSELLTTSDDTLREEIVGHIVEADPENEKELRRLVRELSGKVLVITLNGIEHGDLTSKFLAQLKATFARDGVDSVPLENLRQRFKHVLNIVRTLNPSLQDEMVAETGSADIDNLTERLGNFDENAYDVASAYLRKNGIPLAVVGDETVKDVIRLVVGEYVGEGKRYSRMLILFDEFGNYMEFATLRPEIVGAGVLQHLFEGVQQNDNVVRFVGFIQYELKVYAQRMTRDSDRAEISRYITRYDNADKLFLSSNLETLIASLLVKRAGPSLADSYIGREYRAIQNWFPLSRNYHSWSDEEIFGRVIANGCWPLSPMAMWTLFHLSSSGKYLQGRSALALLKTAIDQNADFDFSGKCSVLPAVALWSSDLENEFVNIEDAGGSGTVMQSYRNAVDRYGHLLKAGHYAVLRAIVLSTHTQLLSADRNDALAALEELAGLQHSEFLQILNGLENEFNVVAWDDSIRRFEILGNTQSRGELNNLIRRRAANNYDALAQSRLFIARAQEIDMLKATSCDFGQQHSIGTLEWQFEPVFQHWENFGMLFPNIVEDYLRTVAVPDLDTKRGRIIYCFVHQKNDIDEVGQKAQTMLTHVAGHLPVMLVLLYDAEGKMADAMTQIDILENLEPGERSRFDQLVPPMIDKQTTLFQSAMTDALKHRRYMTPYREKIQAGRITIMQSALFNAVFTNPLEFPFDGLKSNNCGPAKICADFTRGLFVNTFSHDNVQSLAINQRNIALNLFVDNWKIFAKDGSVTTARASAVVKEIAKKWDERLTSAEGLNLGSAIKGICCAPYGANLASAGLLLAVYCQSNIGKIILMNGSETVGFQTQINLFFDKNRKNFLDVKALEQYTAFRSDNVNSEWEELMSEWGNYETYSEQIAFKEKVEDLKTRIPVPLPLRVQLSNYLDTVKTAERTVNDIDDKIDKALMRIEQGKAAQKFTDLVFGTIWLLNNVKSMEADGHFDPAEIENYTGQITVLRQQICQMFPEWLRGQMPYGFTIESAAKFKALMDRIASDLKELALNKEREALIKHADLATRDINQLAEAQAAKVNAQNWLSANGAIPKNAKIAELIALAETADEQKKKLSTPKTRMNNLSERNPTAKPLAAELQNLADRFDNLKEDLKQAKEKIARQASALMSSELALETAAEIMTQAGDMADYYEGSANDVNDFRLMQNIARDLLDMDRQFSQLTLSCEEFDRRSVEARAKYISDYEAGEPPWDLGEVFDGMIKICMRRRNDEAMAWMESIEERAQDLSSLNVDSLARLRNAIDSIPPYVSEDTYGSRLDALSANIGDAMTKKGAEGLAQQYFALPKDAQKVFLKLIGK